MPKHHFCPERHLYFSDGKILPSVSAVLAMIEYGKYSHVPNGLLEVAAKRGKDVHTLCQAWCQNRFATPCDVPMTNELAGYLAAWIKFCEDFKPQWESIEQPIYSDMLGLAGTPDRIGRINTHGLVVLDIKTPHQKSAIWQLQTAGYKILRYTQGAEYAEAKRVTVQLRKNGRYLVDVHSQESDLTAFKGQLSVINWMRNNGLIR